MIFNLDDSKVAEGTILVFGIQYVGSNSGRVYTYAAMKARGRWYFTGSGRTPQDAGWGAVQRWLDSDGRRVVWVKVPTAMETLWAVAPGEGMIDLSPASETRDAAEAATARRNHSWRTGSPAASMARMIREQNGDDPDELDEHVESGYPDGPDY